MNGEIDVEMTTAAAARRAHLHTALALLLPVVFAIVFVAVRIQPPRHRPRT